MTRRNGFTLVELVVVILILGILAGVAAPKMLNTSAKATDNGLRQTLAIVRDAIELYQAQVGTLPPCTGTGADFRSALTQYIRGAFPKCSVGPALNFDVSPVAGAVGGVAAPTTGWEFSTTSGEFICNFNGPSASGVGNYDTF